MAPVARPGHFNDPDMLQIGNVGLSIDEQYSHMALWCVAGAPLLVGTDVIDMSDTSKAILTNPEVIAIDQDTGYQGRVQGRLTRTAGKAEIWVKRLADGQSWGVVLLNLDDGNTMDVVLEWGDLPGSAGFEAGEATVRDLWSRRDVGTFDAKQAYTGRAVPPHGSMFLSVVAKK